MPTPSEPAFGQNIDAPQNKRSIFGNFSVPQPPDLGRVGGNIPEAGPKATVLALQAQLDVAVSRSFLHRFLAKLFEYPTPESWCWVASPETAHAVRAAATATGSESSAGTLIDEFQTANLDRFLDAHLSAFGHAARGPVPINEIEYGDLKADPLFQPHRLADLAAFYRAFGLEVAPDAGERQDHLCLELEFMSVLAAKEAYALEHQLEPDALAACRVASKSFLREHLGRWTPAFARRVERSVDERLLRRAAQFLRSFVFTECERFGVRPGSEDLLLRPVDETAEQLCASCGIHNLPPGALSAA